MSAFLSPDELHRVTGKRRYSAQRRVLDQMKIAYRAAASGEPLVRADTLDADGKPQPRAEPRWDKIGAPIRNLRG
jgi:Domain of unknown function (DUF4224)